MLEHARLGVATRPGYPRARLDEVLGHVSRPERVLFFDIPELPVSSREIRERVRARRADRPTSCRAAVARLVEERGPLPAVTADTLCPIAYEGS